jgi:hypothetical protein
MEAAAHGHSTLGIPKSVGQDFADADKGKSFGHGGTVEHRQLAKQAQARAEHVKGTGYNMGGEIGSIPTTGTSSSYPPPPDGRKQGPRNYTKKG